MGRSVASLVVIAQLGGTSIAAAAAQKVYWSDWNAQSILRANPDGTAVEVVVSGAGYANNLALDIGRKKLYWTNGATHEIERADTSGANRESIFKTVGQPLAMTLDTDGMRLYWVDGGLFPSFPKTFQRANLDGSNVETLFTLQSSDAIGVAIDARARKVYWIDQFFPYRIRRANLDGTSVETLVTLPQGIPWKIALDSCAGKMYWTTSQPAGIQRANLDGSGLESIPVGGLSRPHDISLDTESGRIYWTDLDLHTVQRASLDGSNLETVVSLESPTALALDLGPEVTFDIRAVPNPAVAGAPFSLRLDMQSRRHTFLATIALYWIVAGRVGLAGTAAGISVSCGLSVKDVPLQDLKEFPGGLPPGVAFLGVVVDQATGGIVAVDSKVVAVR